MIKFEDAGLKNIWLANGYKVKKTPYGQGLAIEDLQGLTHAICAALVRKVGTLSGAEFRYLRQHLQLSQDALGKLFGYTEQAIAKWEKTGKVPLLADKHIRLLWKARADGNEGVGRVVERINEVERLVNQRIILEEKRSGWKSRLEAGVAA
jgi:DNA-binding transcriptional regulator YiaG